MKKLLSLSFFLLVIFGCCGIALCERTTAVGSSWCDRSENSSSGDKDCCKALDAIIDDWCLSNVGKGACSKCKAACNANKSCNEGRSGEDLEFYCVSMCMWKWCGDGPDPEYVCPKKQIKVTVPKEEPKAAGGFTSSEY